MNSGANPFDDNPNTDAEPSWMAPATKDPSPADSYNYSGTQPAAPTSNYTTGPPNAGGDPNAKMWGISGTYMVGILRCSHISVGIFITFSAIWAFVQGKSASSTVIAALYSIFLGTMLVFSEMKIPKLDPWLRQNFGFLYGFKGKAYFLIFCAVFPFSLGAIGITAGCCALANSLFDGFVLLKHPYFQSAKSAAEQRAY